MIIKHPDPIDFPEMRVLWREAFGDSEAFLDIFWRTAFSPERSHIAVSDGGVVGALYWLDSEIEGERCAYIYAVATKASERGKGICSTLMEYTHRLLNDKGYSSALLVPGDEGLFAFYERLGYRCVCRVTEGEAVASVGEIPRKICAEEYSALRHSLLPRGAVREGREGIAFLAETHSLYATDDTVIAVRREGDTLVASELIGSTEPLQALAFSMELSSVRYRTAGEGRAFAMQYKLKDDATVPSYLGLAFD